MDLPNTDNMENLELGKSLIKEDLPEQRIYPENLSMMWRMFYITSYLSCGVLFAIGSYQYYPGVSQLILGGWLFTVGSIGYLMCDVMEWWTNNRVGCFYYPQFEKSFEGQYAIRYGPKNTMTGRFKRATAGLNCFLCVLGSIAYFIGSVFFIPALDLVVPGTKLFIAGSAILAVGQFWKIYRMGCNNPYDPLDFTFRLSNLETNPYSSIANILCLFAGVAYLIGSIYFLPRFDVNSSYGHSAASWFFAGSIFDIVAGLLILYRYIKIVKIAFD